MQYITSVVAVLMLAWAAGCQSGQGGTIQNASDKGRSAAEMGAADAANQNYVGGNSASSAALDADRLAPVDRQATRENPAASQNPAK